MTAREAADPWVEASARVDAAEAAAEAPPTVDVSLDEAQRRRLLVDVERRSLAGLFMHLPAWLLLAGASGLFERQGRLIAAVTSLFLANAAMRVALHLRFDEWVARHHAAAHLVFLGLLLGGAALWGGLLCAAGYWEPLRPAYGALQLVVVAICAAGTMTLAPMKSVRIGMPLVLFGPNVMALLIDASIDHAFLALLSLLFLGYVIVVSRAVQQDYWVGVRAHAQLAERALELERLSVTDALTQLHNRLHFDRIVKLEWARAQRSGDLVTVLIVDLDHFKRINDQHGHPVGDRCLQAAAAAMRGVIFRPADLLARYGGEEFVVLLPGTDVAGGLTVAERLLQSVARVELASRRGPVAVTCSIGAATMRPTPGVDWMALISEADSALYRAKEEGRNRVVTASRWPPGTLATTVTGSARSG